MHSGGVVCPVGLSPCCGLYATRHLYVWDGMRCRGVWKSDSSRGSLHAFTITQRIAQQSVWRECALAYDNARRVYAAQKRGACVVRQSLMDGQAVCA